MTGFQRLVRLFSLLISISWIVTPVLVFADDYTSANFIIRDPVLSVGGGESSSTNFQMIGSTGLPVIGENSSTNFNLRSGGLYFSAGSQSSGSTLIQNTYRWYENVDGTVPSTAMAAENTEITNVQSGSVLRLRMSVTAQGEPFSSNKSYKLQFAARGSNTCAILQSSSYVDVGGINSSDAWIGFDNRSASNGGQLGSLLLTTTVNGVRETYQESNPSSVSPAVIPVGINADAEWDWVVQFRGANNGSSYCFRMILSDGILFNTYTRYPIVAVNAAPETNVGGSGSGSSTSSPSGGGTSPISYRTGVIFEGEAYPESSITVLKDGQTSGTTAASKEGDFSFELSNISGAKYTFSLYAEDYRGVKSRSYTTSVNIVGGKTNTVQNIVIPPTIDINKTQLIRGDSLVILGQTTLDSDVTIFLDSENQIFLSKDKIQDGKYYYNLDTSSLDGSDHQVQSKSKKGSVSETLKFVIGKATHYRDTIPRRSADINRDEFVNLVDFSILLYWFNKTLELSVKDSVDLSKDGVVDLKDFSILVSQWTG